MQAAARQGATEQAGAEQGSGKPQRLVRSIQVVAGACDATKGPLPADFAQQPRQQQQQQQAATKAALAAAAAAVSDDELPLDAPPDPRMMR